MTLPRELLLDREGEGYLLRSIPAIETGKLREDRVKLEPGQIGDRFRDHAGPVIEEGYPLYEIDLVFEYDASMQEDEVEFGIVLESTLHEQVHMGFNTTTQLIHLSRKQNSGKMKFSVNFPGYYLTPFPISENGEIRFHAFVDLSSIELFVDQGALVLTQLVFPESGFESIHLYASHESVRLKEGVIYSLKSVW
jgi:sucrose-6-phosphate hydrolase SacC (GH32 family)